MSNLKFAETHNLVLFLEKPEESYGFKGIIDFLNASSIRYALTVNPTIYTSCIKQLWATVKAKTVNGENWKEWVLRLLLGTNSVALWPQLSSVIPQTKNSTFPSEGSEIPNDPQLTPTIILPSTSQPQKKQPRRKLRKDTKVPQPSSFTKPITDEAANKEHVPIHSNDPLLNFLDLENIKTSQAAKITKLKERVKKLGRRNKSRIPGLKRLRKVGRSAQVVSSEDEGLGAQEDASKQGRKITDLDADVEVTLVDEAQERNDDDLIFDTKR
ncbi:hypothetical protein Tco_1520637 [Tanacetum coccineum]